MSFQLSPVSPELKSTMDEVVYDWSRVMSFQLSPELKSTMDELVYDWIRLNQDLEEIKCDEEDEEDDEDDGEADTLRNDHLKSELFYNDKRPFGKYLKESGRINAKDTIQLMQYCKEHYYNSCNTVQGILDFTKTHDLEYVGTQFGYIYSDVEINVLKEFNSIKYGTLLK